MRSERTLVAGRVALAAGVRATAEHAVLVDRDRLRPAGHFGPVADERELVTLRDETLPGLVGETVLDLQRPTRLVIPARLLDRLLDVHRVIDQSDGELEVRLHLRVTAGRTEHQTWQRPLERHHGVEGVDRPLAGRERVGRRSVEGEARQAV